MQRTQRQNLLQQLVQRGDRVLRRAAQNPGHHLLEFQQLSGGVLLIIDLQNFTEQHIVGLAVGHMIPVVLSQTIYQIGYTLDDFIFSNVMAVHHLTRPEVSALQGVFNTQYNQLVNLPVAIATALAASTVPGIVIASITGSRKAAHRKITSVLKLNMAVAIPCAVGLAVLAHPIMGGAGLILPEITRVNDVHGPGLMRQLSVTQDRHIEPLSRLAAAIHKHNSKIFIQLHHPGRETVSALLGGQPVVSASAIPCKYLQQETRALSTEEVRELIGQFIDGAVRVQKAGCDGVELHCAHGYLLQQFLSPYTNKRTDEYGGSFENRLRMIDVSWKSKTCHKLTSRFFHLLPLVNYFIIPKKNQNSKCFY